MLSFFSSSNGLFFFRKQVPVDLSDDDYAVNTVSTSFSTRQASFSQMKVMASLRKQARQQKRDRDNLRAKIILLLPLASGQPT